MTGIEEANEQEKLFETNSDIFDAEIESDNEGYEEDGIHEKDDDIVIENGSNHEENSDEEDPFHDYDSGEEESLSKIKEKAKKLKTTLDVTIKSAREPKKRKAKKEAMAQLHSESQRLVRESHVKLPYYQPESRDIRHFLAKLPVEDKLPKNGEPVEPSNPEQTIEKPEKDPEDSEVEDLTNTETVVKPKLTGCADPFFVDDTTSKNPAELNHLMQRFLKHNKQKLKENKPEENKIEKQPQNVDISKRTTEEDPLKNTDEAENVKVQKIPRAVFQPGDNLRSLKKKLQANMKVQRAEVRKVHESERKLDNEEISEEEEEEDFDDDEDSDFEVDEWNVEDEKKQERSLEEDETNDSQFNGKSNNGDDLDTNNEEIKQVSKIKHRNKVPTFSDERTIDLFPSDNSNQTANRTLDEDLSDNESNGSQQSIKLRLDSVEDTQDGLTNDRISDFTKLKMLNTTQEQGFENEQQKSGLNKSSESFDRTSSNEVLTPFSRIQRLLGVDSTSGIREKSKPISELTLPVEDSQDLYDEDDIANKRSSDGFNTSKDFNFVLDEDTQFTQFVDTQGFLLSTTKKKRNKDVAKDDQNSNDMSELLGLCSGSFSNEPKKQTEQSMSELLGLCSGQFFDTKPTSESQDNMNELLGLCSGKFTTERKNSESDNQNMSELLGLCSRKFGNNSTEAKCASETQNINEPIGLCSDDTLQVVDSTSKTENSSELFDSKENISCQSESSKKDQMIMNELLRKSSDQFNSVGSIKECGNEKSEESGQLNGDVKKKRQPKQGLFGIFENMTDEEGSMDDVIALCSGQFPGGENEKKETGTSEDSKTAENEESDMELNNSDHEKESDVEDNSENSDNEVFSDDEREVDTEDELEKDEIRKSKKYAIKYGKKIHSVFNKQNFLEDEAELSGSDASSDEEEGSGDDELEEESDIEDLPSDEELQRQVNKVHLKSVIDEDKRELRELKERYLEDGDLYSEGGGRSRNFKWQGLEDSQFNTFENKILWGDDEVVDSALLSEAEVERRKMKHERDQFLQEKLALEGDSQTTDVDENSQNILNLIRDTSSAADEKVEESEEPAPKKQESTSTKLSQKRGSFLNRNKHQMSRLSSVTTMKKTPNSTRGFVFHAISPSSKVKQGQKLQRSVSLSEPPNPKRPRLDRSISNIATGSLFAVMPV